MTPYHLFRGPTPTPTPAATAPAKKTKPKVTPPATTKPKYHTTPTTQTTTDTSTPTTPQNTLPLTDAQKWLKTHPNWTAQRTALWKKNNPNAQPDHRPGIEQTILDAKTLAANLFATPADYQAQADKLAQANYDTAVAGLPTEDKLKADSAQRSSNIKGLTAELFKQLGDIKVADAGAGNAGVGLFAQGAQGADQSTAGRIFAAGGVATPSTEPGAAQALSTIAANNNNMFGGRQDAAAKTGRNQGMAEQNALDNSLFGLQADKSKLAVKKGSDAAAEFDKQQTAGDSRIANSLTYNLYNQQNTTRSQLGNRGLTLQERVAKQKAWAATADRSIKEQQTQINADLASGKITQQSYTQQNRQLQVKRYVTDKLTTGAGGKSSYTVRWQEYVAPKTLATFSQGRTITDTTDPNFGKPLPDVQKGGWKTVTKKNVSGADYQNWQNVLKTHKGGGSALVALGAQPPVKDDKGTLQYAKLINAVPNGGGASGSFTKKQARAYMVASGLMSVSDIENYLATLPD